MSSKNFYYKHASNLCSVFCIACNKVPYSTKENKYLKNQKYGEHEKLQCLNSSCPNGFSTTYQYYNNTSSRRKLKKENIYMISSVSVGASAYMERLSLN